MSEVFYILNYSDYPNRPDILFKGNTTGLERKNQAGTKFIVHCSGNGCECLNYINENETALTLEQLEIELLNAEWNY